MSWADAFWNGGSNGYAADAAPPYANETPAIGGSVGRPLGSLGDISRYRLTDVGGRIPPAPNGMAPHLTLGNTTPEADPKPMRAINQYSDATWGEVRKSEAEHQARIDAEAKRKSRENTQAFGQMIVGLAQAGAQAYAASKQKDLRDRMFQIVYSSGGGGGGIHIPDPLADGIPRVG